MKIRFLSVLGVLAFTASTMVLQAQDYDDIYYDGSSKVTTVKSEPKVSKKSATTEIYTSQRPTKIVVKGNNYQAERDVDEYNRRGISEYDPTDTLSYVDDDMVFSKTQRIERFYNPDIVVASNDADLIELYYDDTPTVNLIIGSNWGYTPRVGWGIGYSNYWFGTWSDPFYDPFYDPYYPFYRPWYYGWNPRFYYSWWPTYGWYSGWYDGIYRPYYYSWGWGHHHGWGHHYHAWDRPGHHRWDGGGRGYRPQPRVAGDGRSLLNGRRTTSSIGSRPSRAGISGINRTNGATRSGSMTGGRTRPNTSGSSMGAGRTRPSTPGNVGNRATTRQGTAALGSGSMRNSRSSSSSSATYGGSRSRSSSSPSYGTTPQRSSSSWGSSRSSGSYGGSRSSGSYGGSRSSGSFGGSRSSGGGFSSGGGMSRGGGGGGGGRRH